MCGIVGYVGNKSCLPFLLEGLDALEYRGYDSAGIAVFEGENVLCFTCVDELFFHDEFLLLFLKNIYEI